MSQQDADREAFLKDWFSLHMKSLFLTIANGRCLNCGAMTSEGKTHLPGCEVAYNPKQFWAAQLNDAKYILVWKGKQ